MFSQKSYNMKPNEAGETASTTSTIVCASEDELLVGSSAEEGGEPAAMSSEEQPKACEGEAESPNPLAPFEDLISKKLELQARVRAAEMENVQLRMELDNMRPTCWDALLMSSSVVLTTISATAMATISEANQCYINARVSELARRSATLDKTWSDIREDRRQAAFKEQQLQNSVGVIRFHYYMMKAKVIRCIANANARRNHNRR